MLALESFVAFKPDFYCETSFNNNEYEFFLHFLAIIEKIRYLIFDLLKAGAFNAQLLT
jgi:hypothetical protein